MTWDRLQKPYIGLHWWYRLLTGRRWTYPYQGKNFKLWKQLIEDRTVVVECKCLNLLIRIKEFNEYWVYKVNRFLYPRGYINILK